MLKKQTNNMPEQERYAVIVFFVVVMVSVGAVTFLFLNAKSNQPKQLLNPYFLTGGVTKHSCVDTDGGVNTYTRGITTTQKIEVIDRCTAEGILEYYCGIDGRLMASSIPCRYGCNEGACMQSAPTAYAFDPFTKVKLRNFE